MKKSIINNNNTRQQQPLRYAEVVRERTRFGLNVARLTSYARTRRYCINVLGSMVVALFLFLFFGTPARLHPSSSVIVVVVGDNSYTVLGLRAVASRFQFR